MATPLCEARGPELPTIPSEGKAKTALLSASSQCPGIITLPCQPGRRASESLRQTIRCSASTGYEPNDGSLPEEQCCRTQLRVICWWTLELVVRLVVLCCPMGSILSVKDRLQDPRTLFLFVAGRMPLMRNGATWELEMLFWRTGHPSEPEMERAREEPPDLARRTMARERTCNRHPKQLQPHYQPQRPSHRQQSLHAYNCSKQHSS